METGCAAIEAFAIAVKTDFVRYAAEFDLVGVSERKPFVAINEKKKKIYFGAIQRREERYFIFI